jgi:hypothetical protein
MFNKVFILKTRRWLQVKLNMKALSLVVWESFVSNVIKSVLIIFFKKDNFLFYSGIQSTMHKMQTS